MLFPNAKKITGVIIPNSLKSIGIDSFFNCISLDRIVIPKSVETIGMNAFEGCANLTIYCEHISKPDDWDDAWCKNGDIVVTKLKPYNPPRTVYWG